MQTMLVTGGTGFIGSHMTVLLLEQGYNVIALDNFSNSHRHVLDGIHSITGKTPIFYEQDMRDSAGMRKIFESHTIDGVIHFAALKAVGESMQKPFEYYDNNIVATLNLLKLMDEFQVRNIVFSSSCTVYGDSDQQPLTEHCPKQPCASPYGWTKSINEDMLMGLCQSTALKVCALRYFNPIGAHPSGVIGEEPHGVPSNLLPYVMKTATGEYPCVRIFGDDYPTPDGTCLRDYIHVMDLVAAHLHAITWISKQKSGTFDVCNIGTGTPSSVLDVIHTTEKVTGKKVAYEIVARREGDVVQAYADPKKSSEMLDWHPNYSLEDAIQDMWRFEMQKKSN